MNDEVLHAWIRGCLAAQDHGEPLGPDEHQRLIELVDKGIVGMDGFKYCWPEEAKENRRRFLASRENQRKTA
jgi:hypothetical protein